MPSDQAKHAADLNAENIGSMVRFVVADKSTQIEKIITAEIDGVAHNSTLVLVTVGSRFADAGKEVYPLPRTQVVLLHPAAGKVEDIAALREGMPR